MKFVNFYVRHYLSSGGQHFETNNTLTCMDEWTKETILHVIYCVMDAAKSVDRQTQLTVLGPDIFALLYSGGINIEPALRIGYILLHNNIVRLLQLALKYFDRGIDVPLSDNVKVLLGHQDASAPAPKRRRHNESETGFGSESASAARELRPWILEESESEHSSLGEYDESESEHSSLGGLDYL